MIMSVQIQLAIYLYVLAVFLPIILLLLGTQIPLLKPIKVQHAMLLGTIVDCIITRTNPKIVAEYFWNGAASGFKGAFSIIVCAKTFVAGMTSLGLITVMINLFSSIPELAKGTTIIGSALMTILTGTGTGTAVSINEIITANASYFGLNTLDMGSVVTIATKMSNPISPVASQMILISSISGSPINEIIKREIPGWLINFVVLYIIFF